PDRLRCAPSSDGCRCVMLRIPLSGPPAHSCSRTQAGHRQVRRGGEANRERSTTMDSQLTGAKLRFPRRLALGAAALSMLAASAFAAPPTAEVNTTGLAITDTVVTVGQLHSATGTMAISETGSIQAERLAIEQINASGGILGRQIKIIQEDGASDWPTFAEKARKLLVSDKVATVFGCWTSASRKAVLPVFEKE